MAHQWHRVPVLRWTHGSPGSLAEKIQNEQLGHLDKFESNSSALYQLILSSSFNTEDDYQAFYDKANALLPKPISTDISDENFGYQRTTTKGFSIRAFRPIVDVYPNDPSLDNGVNVARICGAKRTSLASVVEGNNLFVSDLFEFGK